MRENLMRWLLALIGVSEARLVIRGAGTAGPAKFYRDVTLMFNRLDGRHFEVDYAEMPFSGGLCRIQDWAGACGAGDDGEPRLIDWMGSDQLLSPGDYAAYPDLQMYPTAASAVVPIYNLPSMASGDPALVLAPDVLADIFRSAVTQWDDPRIAAANPVLAAAGKLPPQSIVVVVREDADGSTAVLKRALGQFDPAGFGAQIAESPLPTWAGATVVPCASGIEGTVPCVSSTAYSIGYTGLTEVLALSLNAVSILKTEADVAVAADVRSVESALIELGLAYGNNGDDPDHLTFSLTNGASISAWPITSVSYVALRRDHSHFSGVDSCERRMNMVMFWRWFYTNEYASAHALTIGFVPLPAAARQRVYERLQAEVLCDGQPALQPVTATPLLYSGGPAWLAHPINRYNLVNTAVSAEFSHMSPATALEGLGGDEVHVAFGHFAGQSVAAQSLVSVPYAGVVLAVAFSLCAGVTACGQANQTLVLDVSAVAAVLSGNLTRWLDPRLVALNPWLAQQPHATDIGDSRQIVLVGTASGSATNQAVLSNLQRYRSDASMEELLLPGGSAMREPDDRHVVARLSATRWSMGVVALVDADWETDVSFAMLRSPHNESVAIQPSPAGLAACTMGEEAAALAGVDGWDLWASVAHDCYPLTATVTVLMPRNYYGGNCSQGGQVVRFVQWVIGDVVEGLSKCHLLPLAPLAPKLVTERLFEVSCDGESWLDSRINRGYVGSALRLFVILTAVFLAIILLAICAMFFVYRQTDTIKAAQPLFLGITACGLIIILISGVLSTLDHEGAFMDESVAVGFPGRYPNLDTGCRAQVWLYFIGTSLSLGPLVAKLWRVKVVMINPTMRDIKMRSSTLLKYIGVSVVFDAAILVAWTVVVPPFYRVKVFTFGSDGVESWHGSCDVVPPGAAPYALVLIAKGVLIVLFGIYLCGISRSVRSRYSEGKAMMIVLITYLQTTAAGIIIAWIIYPFSETGSAVGFLLIKWCMPLIYCTTIFAFIFGARLIVLWEEQRSKKKPISLPVIKQQISTPPVGAASPPSRRISLRIKPTGRTASVGVLPRDHGSAHSDAPTQPGSESLSCKASEMHHLDVHASDDQTDSGGRQPHHKGRGVLPRPANHSDKKLEALQTAFMELQERMQVAEEELADARDDNTELRERNNNLVNQLEDVRAQRDAFFFDKLTDGDDA